MQVEMNTKIRMFFMRCGMIGMLAMTIMLSIFLLGCPSNTTNTPTISTGTSMADAYEIQLNKSYTANLTAGSYKVFKLNVTNVDASYQIKVQDFTDVKVSVLDKDGTVIYSKQDNPNLKIKARGILFPAPGLYYILIEAYKDSQGYYPSDLDTSLRNFTLTVTEEVSIETAEFTNISTDSPMKSTIEYGEKQYYRFVANKDIVYGFSISSLAGGKSNLAVTIYDETKTPLGMWFDFMGTDVYQATSTLSNILPGGENGQTYYLEVSCGTGFEWAADQLGLSLDSFAGLLTENDWDAVLYQLTLFVKPQA